MTRMFRRQIVVRVLLLVLAGVSIYLLLPSLLEIFSSWPQLRGSIRSGSAWPSSSKE